MKLKTKLVLFILGCFLALAPLGTAAAAFNNVNVFPNPFRHSLGHTQIQFANLPAGARIHIYDINGNLLRNEQLGDSATSFTWDMKNNSGENVASGVYIYVLIDKDGNKYKGKLAVIR